MSRLTLVSLMAPIAKPLYQRLASLLSACAGVELRFVHEGSWEQRQEQLRAGQVELGVVCGLQYVLKRDLHDAPWIPLVAPVMAAPRYGGRPVYFSDVVVARESHFQRFEDLANGAWSFNEATSHSGYNVVKSALAARDQLDGFFGSVVKGFAHQNSLQLVLSGVVDGAAIDSTVLEQHLQKSPGLGERIRVIDSFGPSPMPPWVAHGAVKPALREALKAALLRLHEDPEGRALLAPHLISRFAEVCDADYDPIRQMARDAERVVLCDQTGLEGPMLTRDEP